MWRILAVAVFSTTRAAHSERSAAVSRARQLLDDWRNSSADEVTVANFLESFSLRDLEPFHLHPGALTIDRTPNLDGAQILASKLAHLRLRPARRRACLIEISLHARARAIFRLSIARRFFSSAASASSTASSVNRGLTPQNEAGRRPNSFRKRCTDRTEL